MEAWQRDLLTECEKFAYSSAPAPVETSTVELVASIGDAIHHVLGHTEDEWRDHLATCRRPLCEQWWKHAWRIEDSPQRRARERLNQLSKEPDGDG